MHSDIGLESAFLKHPPTSVLQDFSSLPFLFPRPLNDVKAALWLSPPNSHTPSLFRPKVEMSRKDKKILSCHCGSNELLGPECILCFYLAKTT